MTNEDLMLPAGFGSPSGSTQKYVTKKLKKADDEFDMRILPMMHSLNNMDDFGLFWRLHFGWNGKNAKDPTKLNYRPFLCLEEKQRGGLITQECPACVYRNSYVTRLEAIKLDLKVKVDALKTKGKEKGIPEAAINQKIREVTEQLRAAMKNDDDWVYNHGLDGKFRIPYVDRQGQLGVFLAPYGVVQDLRKEMTLLRNKVYPGTDIKIQPAGRKGVWFKVTRTGPASRDSDKATPCKIERSDGAEVLDFHVISNEQLQQALERIPDLVELRDQSRITVSQIEALVALDKAGGGSSDPLEVDRIWDMGKKEQAATNGAADWSTNEPKKVDELDWTGAAATGVSAPVETAKEQPKEEVKTEVKVEAKPEPEPKPEPKEEVKTVLKTDTQMEGVTFTNGADIPNFDDLWG